MATTKTIIDVHDGRLTMTILGKTIGSKVFDSFHIPSISTINECFYINYMDIVIHYIFLHEIFEEKLEVALTVGKVEEYLDEETKGYYKMLDSAKHIEESSTSLD